MMMSLFSPNGDSIFLLKAGMSSSEEEEDIVCYKCGKDIGVWECANCGEVPLCEPCVQNYMERGWDGYCCFCVRPKHELAPVHYPLTDDE